MMVSCQESPHSAALRRIANDPNVRALLAKSKSLRGDGTQALWPQFFQAVRDGDTQVSTQQQQSHPTREICPQ
jgi:hypothetical protein